MKFTRSFLVGFAILLFGIGAGFISFVIFPINKIFIKKNNYKMACCEVIQKTWKFITWFLEVTKIIKLEIEEKDNLTNISGKIIVASHRSLIDIVILISLIPKSICLAKKELMKNFLFRNILETLYITNDVDLDEFKETTVKALNDGYNVIIFPTGKRNKQNEDLRIHKGPALISIISGVSIIPISINCSSDFLQLNQPILDAGNKTITYRIKLMPEIIPTDLQKENMSEISLRNRISRKIKESIS